MSQGRNRFVGLCVFAAAAVGLVGFTGWMLADLFRSADDRRAVLVLPADPSVRRTDPTPKAQSRAVPSGVRGTQDPPPAGDKPPALPPLVELKAPGSSAAAVGLTPFTTIAPTPLVAVPTPQAAVGVPQVAVGPAPSGRPAPSTPFVAVPAQAPARTLAGAPAVRLALVPTPSRQASPPAVPAVTPAGGGRPYAPTVDLAPTPPSPTAVALASPPGRPPGGPGVSAALIPSIDPGFGDAAPGLRDVLQRQTGALAEDPSIMTEGEKARRFVMSLCRDLQGRLWVGCEDSGVWCFDPSLPRAKQWRQYTTKDGLGDDNGYAVACDRLGRVWCGHLNHGVSVYNGNKERRWQCYEVVGGLSRPDTLSGPLGERVFHITVNPADGDVWMATSCGLARYSESKDTWSYYTRAEGLPSDQASSLAFDKDGNVYVATQCDGVAMADAKDDYKTWRTVAGPDEEPTAPAGEGLPSSLTNDVLVAKDGTVWVATDAGLAWSKDQGRSWAFIRGADWTTKVRGSVSTPIDGNHVPKVKLLAEDYCTCLSEAGNGLLVVGHRDHTTNEITAPNGELSTVGLNGYVKSVLLDEKQFAAICGTGPVSICVYGNPDHEPGIRTAQLIPAALPHGAAAPTTQEMCDLEKAVQGKLALQRYSSFRTALSRERLAA